MNQIIQKKKDNNNNEKFMLFLNTDLQIYVVAVYPLDPSAGINLFIHSLFVIILPCRANPSPLWPSLLKCFKPTISKKSSREGCATYQW